MLSYSELTNEQDRVRWLRHALTERLTVDPFQDWMTSVELEEMFEDIDATIAEQAAPSKGVSLTSFCFWTFEFLYIYNRTRFLQERPLP